MSDFNGFSISRRGYKCSEVDEFVSNSVSNEKELRENYSVLQQKYDKLFEENSELGKEKDRISADCTTLALALKQLKEDCNAGMHTVDGGYKQKYEDALEDLERMKSVLIDDGYKQKYEEAVAEIERLKNAQPAETENTTAVECGEAASQMVAEVAEVVKKLEKDARRKAEAITLSAKLEQAQAQLARSRVSQEVKGLIEMLECYISDNHLEVEE